MKREILVLPLVLVLAAPFTRAQRTYPSGNLTPEPTANQPAPTPEASATATDAAAKPANTAAAGAGDRKLSYELKVDAARSWTDTGIELRPGDRVTLHSEGAINFLAQRATPEGLARSWREVITALPVNEAGIGALIGRMGEGKVEVPFLVGASKEFTAVRPGKLFLGVNQTANEPGEGTYAVKVQITPAAATNKVPEAATLKLPDKMWDQVPRRIADREGNAGDMVNFMIIGPEEQVQRAFSEAGWVLVDKTKAEAALHALLSTYTKKAYTEMPMSELYLFGRSQDFGYARAEPVQVVQTRHHLRIWKAPFDIDGQTAWVGAATHDIGFEHDNRSPKMSAITHKIDPNIDLERDFVGETLNATGLVANVSKTTPPDPLRGTMKTATGGEFHSDGNVLVIRLNYAKQPASQRASQ